MKKLGKLIINPEKVIKNEELINLKGGSYNGCDPNAGIGCSGSCTTSVGTSGTCKYQAIGSKFLCACVED
ncbi:MAG: hypothetical protein K0B11_21740 [Mariniphaga sp.]|jgi:hypothetical protein|nr:hypothetical protein [Mariniphaga sp.]